MTTADAKAGEKFCVSGLPKSIYIDGNVKLTL